MNGGLSMVEMKSGYKMTEVGVIPEDWEVKELGDITKDMSDGPFGSNLKSCHYTNNKEVRIIQLSNIGADGWSDNNRKYTTYKHLDTIRRCEVKSGNLVIAKMMPAGRAIICPSTDAAYVLSSDAVRVNLLECVNNDYAFYCTKSGYYLSQIAENTQGSTRARTSIKKLRNILFCMPDVKEQVAIATALSDVDSLISALTKKIEKKKAIKQGLMQQLLTGKKRLPGFCGDWIKKNVSSVSDIFRGGSPRPIENYIVKSGGVNWIKIGDVDSSAKYIFRTNEQIIESGIQYSRFVHSGDLLLSNSMSFGRPYILKTEGCIHDGWLVIQNYDKYFDKEFLYYLLGSDEVLKQYKSLAAGSSVLNLNKDIVGKVVLYFPPSISEQTAISNILSDCDSEIAALEEKRDKYKEIKQGMMQQLLTGKIRLIK